MDNLWRDLRYGIRSMAKHPGLTLVAIVTLSLGIGANTAIFSLLDQVLLRRLPVANPQELVILRSPGPITGRGTSDIDIAESFSYPMYKYLRDHNQAFASILARFAAPVSMAFGNQTERAHGELVSGNYFEVLGVRPALGRLFTQSDDLQPGAHPVVVLSYNYWVRRFAADRSILNQTIRVNDLPMTVVGVAQPGFIGVQIGRDPQIFIPIMMKAQITPNWNGLDKYNDYWLAVIARLKPGMSAEQTVSLVAPAYRAGLEDQLSTIKGWDEKRRQQFLNKKLLLDPGQQGRTILQRETRQPLLILMGMVGLVLLIACSNIANLLLAQGAARVREFSIRMALGAGRGRLLRQLFAESILYGLAGGVLGLLVASWTSGLLLRFIPEDSGARYLSGSLDSRVLLFNFALAIFTAVIFGLLPALRSTRPNLAPVLKDQSGTVSASVSASRFRKGLVVAQMALTVLLVIVAGLFAQSLRNLRHVELGVSTERTIQFSVAPQLNGYDPQRTRLFYDQLGHSIAGLPGVRAVSASTLSAFAGDSSSSNVTIEGYQASEGENMNLNTNFVGPGYFSTLGTPLLAGREFTWQDTAESPKVGIINETVARKFFAGRNPLGYKIAFGSGTGTHPDIEIIGVVKDSHHADIRSEIPPFFYLPYSQLKDLGAITFYVRTSQDPLQLAGALQQEVRLLDPNLPVFDVKTLSRQLDELLFGDRVLTMLSLSFGLLAALLAAIGIYGVLAHTVLQRTREIGIRVALGAEPSNVQWLILRDVAWMTFLGLLVGLPAAYGGARLAQSLLYGVRAGKVWVFVAGALLLAVVAFTAGYLPARRASRVDPLVALRYE